MASFPDIEASTEISTEGLTVSEIEHKTIFRISAAMPAFYGIQPAESTSLSPAQPCTRPIAPGLFQDLCPAAGASLQAMQSLSRH